MITCAARGDLLFIDRLILPLARHDIQQTWRAVVAAFYRRSPHRQSLFWKCELFAVDLACWLNGTRIGGERNSALYRA